MIGSRTASKGQSGSGPGAKRSLRRRAAVGITAALAASSLVVAGSLTAFASLNSSFELEGNVLDDPATTPPDWGAASGTNSIFTVDANGVGVPRTTLPTGFVDAGFTRDFTPSSTGDPTTYTGGSKDLDDIAAGWRCVGANNVTNKGDIQNGYVTVFNDTSFTPPHLILYFGMEKNTPNGDNNMGIWFLQDANAACQGGGTGNGQAFTGHHVNGDILLVAAFLNGGGNPQISAYKWQGGANGSLNTTAVVTGSGCSGGSATICAITNSGNVTTPWLTVNNKTQGNTLGGDQFYEGGVDLTANNLDHDANGNPICVNKFVFDTRSSQQLTATLYDYAEGSVQTCAPTGTTTLLRHQLGASPDPTDPTLPPGNNTVTLPATVYDTASVTGGIGTLTGTVTYSLWTDSACSVASTDPTFVGGGNTATVTIAGGAVPASPSLVFATANNYWWQAAYTPGAGSRNDPSTSVCTTEPLTVIKVKPSIATTPSGTISVGGNPPNTINDVANISNGFFPSGGIPVGDVTFKLYGPFDPSTTLTASSCVDSGTGVNLLATSTNAAARLTDSTAKATSDSFTPTVVGKYQWVAKYAGNAQNEGAPQDANGNVVFTACGDTTEQVVVTPVTPPVSTKMKLSDTAKVSPLPGAGAPAGSVTFKLFQSADCSSGLVAGSTQTVPIDSNGAASSNAFLVDAGVYSWLVTFAPDTSANPNYTTASTVCTPAQSDEKATFSYAGSSPTS